MTKKPKPIPKPVETKKEVKNDKDKKIESKLAKIGVPASYVGVTALLVSLVCSQMGACD